MIDRDTRITDCIEIPKIITNILLKDYRNFKYRQYRDDLIGVGNLSLVEAADNYDESEGVCFKTYASRRIEGDIKKYIRQNLREVGHHVHIDSIQLITKEEDVYDDVDTEDREYLIEELRPSDPIEDSIYEDVILGEVSIREKAQELNLSKSKVARIKKKIIKNLKENYIKSIMEEKQYA